MRQLKKRLHRNQAIDRVQLYKPFIFYTVVLLLMHVAVMQWGRLSLPLAGTSLVAGLTTWGFIEYAVHRWILHRALRANFNLPGTLTHLKHHADPRSLQRLNVQLRESLPICIAYFLIAWAITRSWPVATYLFTGLIAGYFFYEYLDFQSHHGTSNSRVVRYFRKHHLQHHHSDATTQFGVTSPLFDYLFGTYLREKKRRNVHSSWRRMEKRHL
jgi:sterol desaturase/sphingolipid hydroxylase (fatty acid hydroxylase superfamily)